MAELEFDEPTHTYRLDGKEIPSVTTEEIHPLPAMNGRRDCQHPKVCIVPECDIKSKQRGLCAKHWLRYKRYGNVYTLKKAPNGEARFKHGSGYVFVRASEHPNATRRGLILEHRLVMAEYLGRPLLPHPKETVHHKNGNRQDNRIENLELHVGGHGMGASGKHCETCRCFDGV